MAFSSVSISCIFLVALICTHTVRASYHDACQSAYDDCDFRFEYDQYSVPTYSISGKADKAFTPLIVSKNKNEKLGVLNTNNITPEFINGNGHAQPITYFGKPHFTPTHFKPYSIQYQKGSGIGHQTFHGNQLRVAANQCVRVFFSTYQLLDEYHNVKANVNANKYDNKCVVFQTRAH